MTYAKQIEHTFKMNPAVEPTVEPSTVTSTVYTPLSIVNIFNNAFSLKEEKALIVVKGIFQPGQGKEYAGFYYDSLKEESGQCLLTLKVSALDRVKLKPGSVVEVRGFINRKVDDKGTIKITANVTEVIGQVSSGYSEADVLALELVQIKANNGYRDVEGFLVKCVMEDKKPVIKIFVGHTAIIDKDIQHGMGESIGYFNPEFVKINLSQPEAIIRAITEIKAHVIVIARGGGTGQEVFNSIEVARAALGCKPYLMCAIGHKQDVCLLDRVVDKQFITPTDIGNFFRDTYNRSKEQLVNSKAKLIEEVKLQVNKEFKERITQQEKLLTERAEQIALLKATNVTSGKLIMYLIVAVIVGIIIAKFLIFK